MTFTSAMRLTITLFVAFGLVTVGIISYAAGASHERAVPLSDRFLYECEAVDISTMGDDLLALHFSVGYKGDYRDGSDNFIYSPGCNVPTAPWLAK